MKEKTEFQKKFQLEKIYSLDQIRNLILESFPEGEQFLPENCNGHKIKTLQVPFKGLGEILTYESSLFLTTYLKTQRTDISREKLLEELTKDEHKYLEIYELDKNTYFRRITRFEKTELGYYIENQI